MKALVTLALAPAPGGDLTTQGHATAGDDA